MNKILAGLFLIVVAGIFSFIFYKTKKVEAKNLVEISSIDTAAKKDTCSILILNAAIIENSIGIPEARLLLANNSKRDADGVKIVINCYNNFDEPINGSPLGINQFYGISQNTLKAGAVEVYTWTLNSFENTTKIKSFISEVHFTDGSRWDH